MADNSRTATPKPNPKSINEGHQNFDLSDEQFTSDGDETKWPTTKTRVSDKEFLRLLNTAYNQRQDLVSQWSKLFPARVIDPSLELWLTLDVLV